MSFKLKKTTEADTQFHALQTDPSLAIQFKAVRKALAYLENNPRHPGPRTHKHQSLSQQYDLEIYEAYAQNMTPGAYRIFWFYGPKTGEITVLSIVQHPYPQ